MSHTPGPWDVCPQLTASENHRGYRIWRDGMGWIADVSPRDADGHEGDANARLIAAAPDLLQALRAVAAMHCMPTEPHRTYRDNADAMSKVRAAIAKAEGKS